MTFIEERAHELFQEERDWHQNAFSVDWDEMSEEQKRPWIVEARRRLRLRGEAPAGPVVR